MQLEVTFRHMSPRDEVRRRAEALYAKLELFLDPAAEGQLIVTVEHNSAISEIVIKTRGHTFKADEAHEDLRTSMDKTFHNVEEQLRRFKDKRTEYKDRGADPESGFVPASVADDDFDDDFEAEA